MYDKIIPDKCELIVTTSCRVGVKLAKLKPELHWKTLNDGKVCSVIHHVHAY